MWVQARRRARRCPYGWKSSMGAMKPKNLIKATGTAGDAGVARRRRVPHERAERRTAVDGGGAAAVPAPRAAASGGQDVLPAPHRNPLSGFLSFLAARPMHCPAACNNSCRLLGHGFIGVVSHLRLLERLHHIQDPFYGSLSIARHLAGRRERMAVGGLPPVLRIRGSRPAAHQRNVRHRGESS